MDKEIAPKWLKDFLNVKNDLEVVPLKGKLSKLLSCNTAYLVNKDAYPRLYFKIIKDSTQIENFRDFKILDLNNIRCAVKNNQVLIGKKVFDNWENIKKESLLQKYNKKILELQSYIS